MRYLEKNVEREYRISGGAIVIEENQILLVRYNNSDGTSYLVGPGGAVLTNEGTYQAVVREVREETGLEVSPQKVLFVEDLLSRRYRIVKIWFLCNLVGGQLAKTQGALDEGITDVAWYRRDQLLSEVVYPPELLSYDWKAFVQSNWESKYLELREADF
jgi:ADP-ribose pyrophosphatase YjhB (NUDIX family)